MQRLLYSPFIFDEQPMVLENPVKTQQSSYDYLNKLRIKALQGSSHKKHTNLRSVRGMNVGMFVTLDSKVGKKSLNIYPSLDLYKIKSISDCKMAVTLINVRTNSVQTVSLDRIELLTPADLISLHNASDIFEIMGKANRQERNTFQMGDVAAHYRYYSPPEVSKEPCNDNLQNEEMIAEVDEGAPSSHMHIPDMPGRLNDNENDGENIDEGSYCSTDVEKGETTQGDQVCQPEIYRLRNRAVYSMLLVSNKHTNFSHLSIKNLQGIMTRDLYKATRKALRDHNLRHLRL